MCPAAAALGSAVSLVFFSFRLVWAAGSASPLRGGGISVAVAIGNGIGIGIDIGVGIGIGIRTGS